MEDFIVVILAAVVSIPGAYIRWIISGKKGSFEHFYRVSNPYRDAFAGFLGLGVILFLIYWMFKMTIGR